MIAFITENLATIIISAVLLALVLWISAGLIKKRRSGKADGCGCGCGSCPSSSVCHKE
jgi:hypothetical protein